MNEAFDRMSNEDVHSCCGGLIPGSRKPQGALREELADFVRDLHRHGMYVLLCGGGAISQPRRAIRELTGKYGTAGLVRLSLELLFATPLEEVHPQESALVAQGVLYHLADEEMLQGLLSTRRKWIGVPDGGEPSEQSGRLPLIETLIAGICSRLGLPYPEGIEPLDPQEEHFLFLAE